MKKSDNVLALGMTTFLVASVLEYFKIAPVAHALCGIGVFLILWWIFGVDND